MIKTAADVSNWSHIPTDADIAALKALGVTRAVVGTSFPHQNSDGTYTWIGDDQCRAFEAAGFEVQEYQFIGHYRPTTRVWWLDVELNETEEQIRAAVIATHPTGIYTRRGVWETLDWDIVAEFPGLKLWNADYGTPPRTFIPYGGWPEPTMVQYHDTMDIGTGLEVDLSYYEEEDDMTAERVWCSDRLQTWIIGKFGAAPVLTPDMDAPFIALYGGHTRAMTGAELDAIRVK